MAQLLLSVGRLNQMSLLTLALGLSACGNGVTSGQSESATLPAADIQITHVPQNVYTSLQGQYIDPSYSSAGANSNNQHLTWLFHVVFRSPGEGYRIEEVNVEFQQGGRTQWREIYPRRYLEKLAWIEGAIEYNTAYFLKNIEFVEQKMSSLERPTHPDIPAGGAITWARFEAARPYFARVDAIQLHFRLQDDAGRSFRAEHNVPVQELDQNVKLHLPFGDTWIAKSGNDLSTGHRRTGLNGLTSYGWDFMKVGEDGRTFRTDGSIPEDYYTYDAPVLAPGDGIVTHMRNDIKDYGIGTTPPRQLLEEDGDVFAGNLVVIDHGNGEYSLTSHMLAGTVSVAVGDRVEAGQLIGRAGNSGVSMAPHIHINLMDRSEWLEARGLPSLFSDFERITPGGAAEYIAKGNPMTGWIVLPVGAM